MQTTTYLVTPVSRIIEAADYRQAQAQARKLHPAGKARPVVNTGVVSADDRPGIGRTLDVRG